MTRSLIHHTPFRRPLIGAFEPLFRKAMLDDFFSPVLTRFTGHDGAESAAVTWSPAADLTQTEDAYTLTVDLPGLSRNDVELTVEDHTLTLSGERRIEREGLNVDRIERVHGRFARRFHIPADADVSTVTAEFENGVLSIVISKAEEAKARKIEIA